MSSMTLKLEPLTQETFEEFGDVISTDDSGGVELINYGLTKCHVRQSEIDTLDKNGATTMRLFDTEPIVLPYRLRIMESHPLGSAPCPDRQEIASVLHRRRYASPIRAR